MVSAVYVILPVHGTESTELRLIASYPMHSVHTMNVSLQLHEHIFFPITQYKLEELSSLSVMHDSEMDQLLITVK
jgi:hypothetical protein